MSVYEIGSTPLRAAPTSLGKPCDRPRTDDVGFELRDRRQDVKLETARGSARVDAILHRDEIDPTRMQVVQSEDEVANAASEPVELPDGDERTRGPMGFRARRS